MSDMDEFEVKDGKLGKVKPRKSQEASAGDLSEFEAAPGTKIPAAPKTASMDPDDNPFLVGLAQGASFGFSDELMARLESLMAGTDYKQNWDRRQGELEALRTSHPGKMLGGEMVGAVGGMVIPGIGVARAAQGASKAAQAARAISLAMGQGAAEGFGKSTYSTLEDYEDPSAKYLLPGLDMLQGGIEGLMGLGVARTAGEGLKLGYRAVEKPAKAGLRKGLEWASKPMFKVNREVAKDVLENPALYKGEVETIEEIADQRMMPLVNKVSKMASDSKALARGFLRDEHALDVNEFGQQLMERFKEADIIFRNPDTGKLTTKHGEGLMNELRRHYQYARTLAGDKAYLTEKEAIKLEDYLDDFAKWDRNSQGWQKPIANTYKQIQGFVSQSVKSRNKDFADNMKLSQKYTKDADKARELMTLKPSEKPDVDLTPEELAELGIGRYKASRATLGKMRQIRNNEPVVNLLEKLSKEYGDATDLPAVMKRVRNEQAMAQNAISAGTIAGGATGGVPGAMIGALRDVLGPDGFKKAAQATIPGRPLNPDPWLRPATVNLMTSPILNPYHVGYPLQGMSAERYREGVANGEWE